MRYQKEKECEKLVEMHAYSYLALKRYGKFGSEDLEWFSGKMDAILAENSVYNFRTTGSIFVSLMILALVVGYAFGTVIGG